MNVLSFRDVWVEYGDKIVLEKVTLDVAEGGFVSIVGPSGAGKSTFLRLVLGQEAPSRGRIYLDGQPLSPEPGPDRGVVFQQSALFPWLTVRQNVAFGLELAANKARKPRGPSVDAILKRVGLAAFADHFPSQLSGGMRQRAAIASVLVIDPGVLLMDEPFGALDALTRSLMQDFLLELWEENRKTVLLVTHDITEAVYLADRLVIMAGHPGRVREIVKQGTSADRQLARFEAVKGMGGSEQAALVAVVDGIIDDTMLMPS